MSTRDFHQVQPGRREVIGLLGMSAGLGLVAAAFGENIGLAAAGQGAGELTFPKGAVIRTVLKDVAPEALGMGATLFHEHLSLSNHYPYQPPPKEPPPPHVTEDIDLMADELRQDAKDGVLCIVDAGPRDLGRNVENLRQMSVKSGVHIVACGGFFMQSGPRGESLTPPEVLTKSAEQAADFQQEAKRDRLGAFGEIGTSATLPPAERKVLEAVSIAHLRSGLPIITHNPHTGCAQCARDQADIYESHGVDLHRVAIGHLSDIGDDPLAKTAIALAKRGAYLGFDTLALQMGTSTDENKIKMILAVLEAGYENQVLLSGDHAGPSRKRGGAGYASVLTMVVPKLRSAGVKEATIRKILNDNPRRFLAFVPKEP
jgi:phosphotriesterase-related protein